MSKPKQSVCDFCSDPHPVTAFPVRYDTILPGGPVSRGPWTACSPCAVLIRTEKKMSLAIRAVESFQSKVKMPVQVLTGVVLAIHDRFWVSHDPTKPEVPLS